MLSLISPGAQFYEISVPPSDSLDLGPLLFTPDYDASRSWYSKLVAIIAPVFDFISLSLQMTSHSSSIHHIYLLSRRSRALMPPSPSFPSTTSHFSHSRVTRETNIRNPYQLVTKTACRSSIITVVSGTVHGMALRYVFWST